VIRPSGAGKGNGEIASMQIRCQRCGQMFTLSREATAAAVEELRNTKASHYNVECPKCRRVVKVRASDFPRTQEG
jgi:ribosomal protein S27E